MLFNSFEFIFFFLPITLVVYLWLGHRQLYQMAIAWLVGASLFFYGWWNPAYLGLLIASILFNYSFGAALGRSTGQRRHVLLFVGVSANLAMLGYFKYANFFLENLDLLTGGDLRVGAFILPLGISFITFQKIAYLVDAWQGRAREYNFLHFALFVTFFPQLIAGPIVHHREVMPQFAQHKMYRLRHENLAIGLSIFFVGLFKKTVIADNLANFASPIFGAAGGGVTLTFFEAWTGALAYSFQLYFDFSGYSDMAIGLARLFGVRLPLNFHSPYKATNIIDFWRRWHITLSRFLRDYLYIPLGGNRQGTTRRYLNLLVTMLLGGLWHGAAWTFVIWGGLHGLYLLVNHAWRGMLARFGFEGLANYRGYAVFAGFLTFMAVVCGWVFFRAADMHSAQSMLQSMAGANGVDLVHSYANDLVRHGAANRWIAVAMLITWLAPNTQQLFAAHEPSVDNVRAVRIQWQPSLRWALGTCALALVALYHMNQISEFLYFQF